MKNYFTTTLILVFATATAFAQNNVRLEPVSGNVCSPMPISIHINGNSFNPVSYLWSTGETSPVIEIVTSGTYTCTITGYHGNSNNNLDTITRSAVYNVLAPAQIIPLTSLTACKGDTFRLAATPGYDYITWSDGSTASVFQKSVLNPVPAGSPKLDTLSVSYVATIDKLCSSAAQKVVLRSVRRPDGVGYFYQGKMNIKPTDSIPAGLVLKYIYPVSYEMVFTEISNPSNVITYVTAPGFRKAPASMLTPGTAYSVVSTPIINGVEYCAGDPSTIGVAAPSGNRMTLGFTEEEGVKTYRVYNVQGQLLMEKQSEEFNQEWVKDLTPQMIIIEKTGITTEITKMQIVR